MLNRCLSQDSDSRPTSFELLNIIDLLIYEYRHIFAEEKEIADNIASPKQELDQSRASQRNVPDFFEKRPQNADFSVSAVPLDQIIEKFEQPFIMKPKDNQALAKEQEEIKNQQSESFDSPDKIKYENKR